MRIFKLVLGLVFISITFKNCFTAVPMNQQFYNTKKVGVIIQTDSIGIFKSGGQGLLDIALTPGDRFREPLKSVEKQIMLNNILKNEVSSILQSKNKSFIIIDDKLDFQKFKKFESQDKSKKYFKKDIRELKEKYNVDEILYLNAKHGLLVSYYGMVEIGKEGYADFQTYIFDLNDNSILLSNSIAEKSSIDGNWKKGENFENLKNSINSSVKKALEKLKTKF